MTYGHLDAVAELQSLFLVQQEGKFLLWSQFEQELALYDRDYSLISLTRETR